MEVGQNYGFEIQEVRVAFDHVHIFLGFPPGYSIAKVVGMLNTISSSDIFEKLPEVKKELGGGEFWKDGYFVSTVGIDREVIKRYVKAQQEEQIREDQLSLWKDSSE